MVTVINDGDFISLHTHVLCCNYELSCGVLQEPFVCRKQLFTRVIKGRSEQHSLLVGWEKGRKSGNCIEFVVFK